MSMGFAEQRPSEVPVAVLPVNSRFGIHQSSVELVAQSGQRSAIVSFELFFYPASNGGVDTPMITLSQTGPFHAKDVDALRPDYDRMVQEAAAALEENLKRVAEILGRTARP